MPRRKVEPTIEIAKALAKLGKASFGEILKEADISRQALDIHLKRMLDKKLILSEQDPKDKRKYLYWLNPNELAVVTVDEVIEAIKDELKAVGEELNPEEERNLRKYLIEIRDLIIDVYLKREAYKEFRDPIQFILRVFTPHSVIALSYHERAKKVRDKDKFKELYRKYVTYGETDKLLKKLLTLAIDYIEYSLAKKWIKTISFRKTTLAHELSYAEPIAEFMAKITLDEDYRNILYEMAKLEMGAKELAKKISEEIEYNLKKLRELDFESYKKLLSKFCKDL